MNRSRGILEYIGNANWNVLGLLSSLPDGGVLAERYEYSPYGNRTVLSHGWLIADMSHEGAIDATDYAMMDDAMVNQSGSQWFHRADFDGSGSVDATDSGVLDDMFVNRPSLPTGDAGMLANPTAGTFRGVVTSYGIGYRAPGPLNEFGRQGLHHDEEFGLVYNRARMMHPILGRFVQRDPMGYIDGADLYQSVIANPLNRTDPNGTDAGWARHGMGDAWGRCRCGPDVTGALLDILDRVVGAWRRMNATQRKALDDSYYSNVASNWDITDLAARITDAPECPRKFNGVDTVTVNSTCYPQEEVNYWLYGIWTRLSGKDPAWAIARTYGWRYATRGGTGIPGRTAWLTWGYLLMLPSQPIEGHLNNFCKPCYTYVPKLKFFIGAPPLISDATPVPVPPLGPPAPQQ
ncbi:RHS repeat-associated core domain-containing protein [Fontivita pretiosa]|uniref:RHS repeat-associated core domain-containing protein n=1 Tax=Fontivita pretiosa TaxID=2989684 RepID=UPI003D182EBD